jgi:putative SOS response-associated peptidase YedK
LIPFWSTDAGTGRKFTLARAEGIATTPAYRHAFANRRCLIVVDGFFEWQAAVGGKRPYRVCREAGEPFTLAGVWERWKRGEEVIRSCAIVTAPCNALMRPIHDRMPVIVGEEDRDLWMSERAGQGDLLPLLQPYRGDDLIAYEVSKLVNDPRNDVPECLEPLEPGEHDEDPAADPRAASTTDAGPVASEGPGGTAGRRGGRRGSRSGALQLPLALDSAPEPSPLES